MSDKRIYTVKENYEKSTYHPNWDGTYFLESLVF